MRSDAETRRNLVLMGLELALKLFESPRPVVVGCSGHAIAAGTLLLLGADHVVVGDGPVKIGLNETTIGIELSPFVIELARYRLLPSASQPDTARTALRRGSCTPGRIRRRGRRVRRPDSSLTRSGEPFGRARSAELPADEGCDEVEHGRVVALGARAEAGRVNRYPGRLARIAPWALLITPRKKVHGSDSRASGTLEPLGLWTPRKVRLIGSSNSHQRSR